MKQSSLLMVLVLAASVGIGSAAAQQPAQGPDSKGGLTGKVVETMDAGEYTYVRVDTGKTNVWVAAPKFQVKVGDTASLAAGMAMPDYHSKTLNRDFPVVYFTDRVAVNGALASAGAAGGMQELPKGHPAIGPQATAQAKVDLSGIKKAEGGNTVAEIYAQQTKLSGKEVKVRGKVVKYNGNIMGKNWVHLRDGTGTEGSNDLLVTTSSEAKVGDTVLASGTVSLNKDFGANYKYPVMIEDGKIVVE
jgi:hypothetical protein